MMTTIVIMLIIVIITMLTTTIIIIIIIIIKAIMAIREQARTRRGKTKRTKMGHPFSRLKRRNLGKKLTF